MLQLLVAGVGLLVFRELLGASCYDVNHAQLEVLLVEQQVLVLRVNIDEPFAQLLHLCQRYGCVVDEGAALALCRQFAAQYAVSGIVVYVVLLEEGLHFVA